MSDQFRTERLSAPPARVSWQFPPLPTWLTRLHFLRSDETITWVGGPQFSPPWERYVTHPMLFVIALALAAAFLGSGRVVAGSWSDMSPLPFVAAFILFIGSVFVLGFSSGYFTRLVVTNKRIVILQGREVARSWGIRDLPRSLLRYTGGPGEESSPPIDLDTMRTMVGGAAGGFVEAKTILDFGKQIGRIKRGENGRP